MKSNKGDEAIWQNSRKGDLLKRSLNQYQYQYPTPASVSHLYPTRSPPIRLSIITDHEMIRRSFDMKLWLVRNSRSSDMGQSCRSLHSLWHIRMSLFKFYHSFLSRSFPLTSITYQESYYWIPYKLIICCFQVLLSLLHTQMQMQKKVSMYDSLLILTILHK